MRCQDIVDLFESKYPKEAAASWDNVGLLIGSSEKEVSKIIVALDPTDKVIDMAVKNKADMMITHHPMMFGKPGNILNEDVLGSKIIRLIKNDISYYVMHTNYDVYRMGGIAADKLGLINQDMLYPTRTLEDGKVEGIGKIGEVESELMVKDVVKSIKKEFNLDNVILYGDRNQKINRVAVCPGSGKRVIDVAVEKKADLLITGDIGYHEGADALLKGMVVIDAGHDGLEHIFVDDVAESIRDNFEDVDVIKDFFLRMYSVV